MRIYSPAEAEAYLMAFGQFYAALNAREWYGDHVCMAAQIVTEHGSQDSLVGDAVPEAAQVTGAWAQRLIDAVDGLTSERAIRQALDAEIDRISEKELGELLYQQMLDGLRVGALDSKWERENEDEVQLTAPVLFRTERGESLKPRAKAAELFESRKVMDRESFDALSDRLKARAFTYAGTSKQELLNVVHAELAKQVRNGTADLRDFKKFVAQRVESAGWTPKSPTHIETIFRTSVASAFAAGRYAEQTQPAVIAALPYWQIVGIKDARQRKTHRRADGIVLPATHEFWQRAYPPFGFNCRCRAVARTSAWVKRTGAKIGPVPTGLPDPGFTAGPRGFVSVPESIRKNTEPTKQNTQPTMPGAGLPSSSTVKEQIPIHRDDGLPYLHEEPPTKVEPMRQASPRYRIKPLETQAELPKAEVPTWEEVDGGYRGVGFDRDVSITKVSKGKWEVVIDGEAHALPKKPTFDHAEKILREKKFSPTGPPIESQARKALEESAAAARKEAAETAENIRRQRATSTAKAAAKQVRDERKPLMSPVVSSKELGGGVNGSHLVELENGQRGVWKPANDENIEWMDGEPMYKREALAHEVDRLLGLEVTPPTTTRALQGATGNEFGSIQQFSADAKPVFDLLFEDDVLFEELERTDGPKVAMLDVIMANPDRHSQNLMVAVERGRYRYVAIDNGAMLPPGTKGVYRVAGHSAATADSAKVKRLTDFSAHSQHLDNLDLDSLAKSLAGSGIDRRKTEETIGRAMALQKHPKGVSSMIDHDAPNDVAFAEVNVWINGGWRRDLSEDEISRVGAIVRRAYR